mgnify:CR=1 FL=1
MPAIALSIILLISIVAPTLTHSYVLGTENESIKLKFTVYVLEYDPVRIRVAELLRDYAKEVGISIGVIPADLNVEIAKVQDEHDFWLYILNDQAETCQCI